ncbi:UBN2_3 domain-containing protein [Gossypium australe]|uniref:UBN2_3 domain-containing protein n=1 Tax=Gossypium australe TaxID=47621 RepID=A0A5B6WWM2_9ROSI|nr:UBN2_3 domain-containing protein [Gossypium australe]
MVNSSDLSVDFNHPLYLHPSGTPSALLVSYQLLEIENYNIWTRSMQIALLAKSKLGFERCNVIVLSWILNTVSRELSAGIVFASSAAVVWKDLDDCFNKVDGSQVYFLHRKITSYL